MRGAAVLCIFLAAAGCSGSKMNPPADSGPGTCAQHAAPSFVLGTGDQMFISPLVDEQELQMERGAQGGCHLPLAFETDGFAQRRFTVAYRLSFAEDDREIIHSRETRNLAPKDDDSGVCELLAFRAFLLMPWTAEDRRVKVHVDVTDDLGATGTAEVIVKAKWPDEVAGTLHENLCGLRTDQDAGSGD